MTMYRQLLALPLRLVLTRHPLGSRGNLATREWPGGQITVYSSPLPLSLTTPLLREGLPLRSTTGIILRVRLPLSFLHSRIKTSLMHPSFFLRCLQARLRLGVSAWPVRLRFSILCFPCR